MRTKNELYQEALRTVAEAEAAVPGLRHAEE